MLEDVVGVIRVSEVLNVGESMSRPYPFPVNGSTPADDALMRQIVPQRNVVISTGTPSLFFGRGIVSITWAVATKWISATARLFSSAKQRRRTQRSAHLRRCSRPSPLLTVPLLLEANDFVVRLILCLTFSFQILWNGVKQ